MTPILIVYSSRYGQTAKIVLRMARIFQAYGLIVDTFDIQNEVPFDPDKYTAVIIGAPIYIGKAHIKLVKWVYKNRRVLQKKVTGLFTVSLNAADERLEARKDDHRLIEEFTKLTDWVPSMSASFKGALHYTSYNFFLRFIMKRISRSAGGPTDTSRNYELTNWKEVDVFTEQFLQLMKLKTAPSERTFS